MSFEQIKEILFAAAVRAGLKEYDVYCAFSDSESAEALNGALNSCSSDTSGGVCFRCVHDGKLGSASTESLQKEELEALVGRAMENAAVTDADDAPIFYTPRAEDTYNTVAVEVPALPGVACLRRTVMELQEKLYAASSLMTDGTTSAAGASHGRVALANSKGLSLSRESGAVYTYVEPIVNDGKEPSFGSAMAYVLNTDTDIVEKATGEALARLGAGLVKTGKYDVIFDAKRTRALLSTFSGIFSGKAARLGLSLLAGKEGEQIAAKCVTILDDPFYKDNPMQCAFDAEGVPTSVKTLVDGGVLKTLLYDLTNAQKMGVASTGNAARGYASPVSISPYCLRIAPGKESPEAMRRRMKDGLYITELKGLHAGADAVTGDFSIESAGFWVENGEITAPVHSFTVAGNFFDLLQHIDGVADNVEMGMPGTSTLAAPDIMVRGLAVAGE